MTDGDRERTEDTEGFDEDVKTALHQAFATFGFMLLVTNFVGVIFVLEETAPGRLGELEVLLTLGMVATIGVLALNVADIYREDLVEALERARSNAE